MRPLFIPLLFISLPCYGIEDFNKIFNGSINKQFPIEITLDCQNHVMNGSYKYLNAEGNLKLKGKITDNGHFTLNEYNTKGSLTGEFYGKLIESHLVGVWKKPDGNQSYTFLATESSNGSINAAQENDSIKIYQLIYEWSEAHNTQDMTKFESLFANEVLFYCKKIPRVEVLRKKRRIFNKYQIFMHFIISDIHIQEYSSGLLKCSFTKQVTGDEKTIDFPSYLLISTDEGRPLIVGESDLITDENLKYTLDIGTPVDKSKWKIYLIYSLLISLILLIFYRLFIRPKTKNIHQSSATTIEPHKETKQQSDTPISHDTENEIRKYINKGKGEEFEKFVISKFDTNYFTLLEWRSDKAANGIFPESNKSPDLEYKYAYNKYISHFAIECKYRSSTDNGMLEISRPDQLIRYKQFSVNKKMDVYFVIGFGGIPEGPNEIFLVPLKDIEEPKIPYVLLKEKYKRSITRNFFYNMQARKLT